ncbi:MAG: CAP domain-containing protein [Dehalococcoidia bacterium]
MNHKLTRALGAIFMLGAFAWTAAASPAASALNNCNVDDLTVDGEEQAFLQLINQYRAGKGADALSIDPALTRASTWMASDLAGRGDFSHTDSSGRSPWTRMPDCGVAIPAGENLAAGTNYSAAQTALTAWINSPSHRDVMLDKTFKTIGISRVYREGSRYGWYWVTDFGYGNGNTTSVATTTPTPAPTAAPAPRPAQPAPPTPESRLLGIPAGLSLVMWEGGYVSPEEVFGGHDNVQMVYVFDLGTQTWLRWGEGLNPEIRTLTQMRNGVQYWIVATGEAWVPMD